MATTIRLTRMGRKQAPFYRVVVTDSRARRDGAYIESLGFYNPMPDAYQLDVDHRRALHWLDRGAEVSDTARSLLRNEGVLLRWHLSKEGVDEGEIDRKVEEFRARRNQQRDAIKADSRARFEAWKKSKEEEARKKADESEQAAAAASTPAGEGSAEEPAAEEPAAEEPAAEAAAPESSAEPSTSEEQSSEEEKS